MEVEVEGRRVFIHTGGVEFQPSPRTVLLVHGAGNDHTIWRFLTRRLAAAGHRVVAPDLPDHGKSDGPALPSVEAMATWCFTLADAIGATDLTVIGHSMGALIAMEMATQAPDRVRAVGLIAPAERMKVHPDLQAAAEEKDRLAADFIVGWTHTGRSRFGQHDSAGAWMAGTNRRLLERNAGSLASDLAASAAWDGAAEFASLAIPALLVASERDRMVPARSARKLLEAMPGGELVEVSGGSHASLYDHPEDVVPPVMAWLARLPALEVGRD